MTNNTQNLPKIKACDATTACSSSTLGFAENSEGGGDERSDSLPCLYSNNSIEGTESALEKVNSDCIQALACLLTPYHKKQAESLFLNVTRLIEKEAKSPNHVGLLTLTFKDNVTDNKEASRRFNSFKTNFLNKHSEFGHWANTKEQQTRGAWHYHLVVCLEQDIKTGINFEELKQRKYTSASPYLRKIWKELREAMPKYQFGRSELQPIRTSAEAMGRYVGKYISKHIGQRDEESKGVRLISYSQGWAKNSMKFSWNTENAKQWRKKLSLFARMNGCKEFYQLSEKLGANWAYKYTDEIFNIHEYTCEALCKESGTYESPTIERIKINKLKTEKKMVENLSLTRRKTKRVQKIEESQRKVKSILLQGVSPWLTDERIENAKKEIAEERENHALRQAIQHKESLNRLIMAGKEFTQKTEGVPF